MRAATLVAALAAAAQVSSSAATQLRAPRTEREKALCDLKSTYLLSDVSTLGEPYQRMRKQHQKCAVVSNSGVLKAHHHGKEIDDSEIVIRFNSAPTDKYADIVGKKDVIRIVNTEFPTSALQHKVQDYDVRPNMTFVIVPYEAAEVPEMVNKFHSMHPDAEVYQLSPPAIKNISSALRALYAPKWFNVGKYTGYSYQPTPGALGMLLAMDICKEVRAYGMAQSKDAAKYSYHYYENFGVASDSTWHKTIDAEKDLWRFLAQNSAEDIDSTDVAVIPGFSALSKPCGAPSWKPVVQNSGEIHSRG